MKLIDLLVQELPKRGGWPDGAVECQRFVDEANIDFYDENGNWDADCLLTYGDIAAELVRKQVFPCEYEQVTFDEYQSALAASQKVEWSGDALPRAGCECESKQFAQVNWTKFKVVAVCDGHVFGFWGNGVSTALDSKMWEFRQLRSEAGKKRDEAIEAIDWYMPEFIPDTPNEYYHAKKIYDAIAAGKIPGVKLDD